MVDVNYCDDPNLVQLIPRAAEGVRQLRNAGYLIIIVTNQSGIGRGYFDVNTLEKIHEKLRVQLRRNGADFDAVYYCPHTPGEGCDCRKPRPGLIFRAADELGIDLQSSYTVGDRDIDVQAGKAAGTRTVLVWNRNGPNDGNQTDADFVVGDLEEGATIILKRARSLNEKVG